MSGRISYNPLYQPVARGGMNLLYQGSAHKYPSQVIVQFVTGGRGDTTIEDNVQALHSYGKALGIDSRIVKVRTSHSAFHTFSQAAKAELATAFGGLNTGPRVYLQAHGD